MAGGRHYSAKEDAAIRQAVADGARTEADFPHGLALGRSWSGVEGRLLQLGARERVVRDYVHDPEPDRSVQTGACAKHARACLRAGGFWAFSERRVGAGKWAVCLPMLPPPAHLWGAGQ